MAGDDATNTMNHLRSPRHLPSLTVEWESSDADGTKVLGAFYHLPPNPSIKNLTELAAEQDGPRGMDLTRPAGQHQGRGIELGDDGGSLDRVAGAQRSAVIERHLRHTRRQMHRESSARLGA